jgi:hypothetical protein
MRNKNNIQLLGHDSPLMNLQGWLIALV